MSSRRLLVLFAHPSPGRSEINSHLAAVAKSHLNTTFVDLYAEYPDYRIDIDKEQQRLCEHDVIIFLFPLFWYSTPALLKEWQDLVLEYGFAYGNDGTALSGKYFLCACSAGGEASAYCEDGYNGHSLRDLLLPLEQTAGLCHMRYLPPFVLFGSRTAVDEGRRDAHVQAFAAMLDHLANAPLDTLMAGDACTLNELLLTPAAELTS